MQKRNLILQAAVAGVFGVVGAEAATLGPTTAPVFAKESVGTASTSKIRIGAGAGVTSSGAGNLKLALAGTENYVGRSTAFNVKITLAGGATFGTQSAATFSSTANAASAVFTNTGHAHAGGTFTISLLAGGSGSTFVTLNLAPAASTSALGGTATLDLGTFGIVNPTLTSGTAQTATANIVDPVTATVLDTIPGTIATTQTGVVTTVTPSTDTNKFIDVSTNSIQFTKTTNSNVTVFPAGTVQLAAASGVLRAGGTAMVNADITLPTLSVGASNGLSLAPFNVGLAASGTDTTVGDLSHIYFTTDATCQTVSITASTTASPGATSLVFQNASLTSGTSYNVCFAANESTTILPGTPTVTVNSVNINNAAAASATLSASSASLLPMTKNGFATSLYFVVPSQETAGTETGSQLINYTSYIRITNTSGIPGPVYITMTDDAGTQYTTATSSPLTTLAAHASALYTAGQLETAAGMTTPVGRVRLDVNGAFPTGAAISFLVNPNGTLVNMSANK